MIKIIPISKARVNLGSVVMGVLKNNDYVILEKGNVPVASIVGVDLLEDMQDAIDLMIARKETQSETLVDWNSIRKEYA